MSKLFPNFYDLVMKPLESTRFKKERSRLISKATGHVLEIGSGTGANFPYYKNAHEVTAIEPNPKMIERSESRILKAPVPIKTIISKAEKLPFDDNTFDTIVATLVFCTIAKPEQALAELKRVAKADAKLLFFEHVRFEQAFLGKMQDLANPLWNTFSGGCQLNRNTLETLEESGLEIKSVNPLYNKLLLAIEAGNKK